MAGVSLNDGRVPGITGIVAATLAASCCILPLALIATGVAGASVMMTMMRYEWITLPLGVLGLAGAYVAYWSHHRRCQTAGCQFVGRRTTQVILLVASLVVVVALLFRLVPSWTADLLQRL